MLAAVQERCSVPVRSRCLSLARPSLFSCRRPAGAFRAFSRRSAVGVKALLEIHDSAAAATHSLLDSFVHHSSVLLALSGDPATAAAEAITVAGTTAAAAAAGAVSSVAAAAPAATSGGGPFDFLADGFEKFLTVLDEGLEKLGVPYSYGFAIIILTVLVKAATFPLSMKQVQSTIAMQSLQPAIKELQAKHAGDAETLQTETARLYRDAGVNPLAGCLPTLATIPVFIGLYRALSKAAEDGLLTQSFFWIPSLAGPTSLADRQSGSGFSWLFPFENGHPPIGWHDALAYMVMPVLLVVSQFVSQKVISPQQNQDPQAASANQILKFLPLLIGWFSLNVPSGLTLYWFVNNILSTTQQVYLKSTAPVTALPNSSASSAIIDTTATVVTPKEERVKKVAGKELGARKKKKDESEEADEEEGGAATNGNGNGASQNSRGKSKGEKFRALKAREAASKAKAVAQPSDAKSE